MKGNLYTDFDKLHLHGAADVKLVHTFRVTFVKHSTWVTDSDKETIKQGGLVSLENELGIEYNVPKPPATEADAMWDAIDYLADRVSILESQIKSKSSSSAW